nr:type IX secretion system sortase PorU [Chryseosolibacter indicus]
MLALLIVSHSGYSQSVLASGNWYKVSVQKDGVYKITYNQLKTMGFNVGAVNPKKISIFGNSGGMLPQLNNAVRPVDLNEIAIQVVGEEDGKFDSKDYILFYAEGPDKATLDITKEVFHYQNNIYSDKNFYFICITDKDGKRIHTSENLNTNAPTINEFNDYYYHENDLYNILESGREWYGESFAVSADLKLSLPIKNIIPGSDIKILSEVMGQSAQTSSFEIFVNGTQIGEQLIPAIPSSNFQYGLKGQVKRDTFAINETRTRASNRNDQEINYRYIKPLATSKGFLNFVLVSFKRSLAMSDKQIIFSSAVSIENPISGFEIGNAKTGLSIWDVSDPINVKKQDYQLNSNTAHFITSTDYLKKFIAFTPDVEGPKLESKVPPQNLHGLSTPNLIIVTHPNFFNEASRLAAHRQSFSNWSVHVVTIEQIYNEYSSGRQDVSAIRDFVRDLYKRNTATLKALLLFGKGSYDYKSITNDNTNFVPTYESRNSLHPLQTYSSDDYFTFMDDNEGEWQESPAQDHTLDIGVGRLPVTTIEEARDVVDKIIQYDSNKKTLGYWRKELVFVADDGNGEDNYTNLHQKQADDLTTIIGTLEPSFDTRKIFMGTYPKTLRANGEITPKMSEDIIRAFDRGALIVNYTGHGSDRVWADEQVLTDELILKLENKQYPFLVTATCEFGRNDHPVIRSSAELCVIKKEAGAIGMVTTTRPVNAETNFELNKAFYESLFQRDNNGYPSLGEVFRNTKNNSTSGVFNRNFSLLADPSLTLALPPNTIKVNSIQTQGGSDTLKALSKVIVKGQIDNVSGEKLTSFNGLLEATLFDKETELVTVGRSTGFKFKEWRTSLFRGKASVRDGDFTLEFFLPKNISYSVHEGRLSLYASDAANNTDANGSSKTFKIGGSESNTTTDNTPPEIKAFMGDSTFINGGIVTPNTYLVAKISDEHGINISDYGIGNGLLATLDIDVETFILNSYFVSNTDDYTTGWLRYPIKNLAPGKHTITIKAWDVFNNPAQSSVDFIVTDGESIRIETFGNYPNPFNTKSTLFFTHNRPGDDIKAHLFIYAPTGNLLKTLEIPVFDSQYRVDLYEMDNSGNQDKKLPAGLYLARLVVRSLTNGSKSEQVTKLIILN